MATPRDEHFWNTLGNYDEEIISIFKDADAARPLVEAITRHIVPETVVTDPGTGTGNLLPYLKAAKKVYAVDKSENMLAQARAANSQTNDQLNHVAHYADEHVVPVQGHSHPALHLVK